MDFINFENNLLPRSFNIFGKIYQIEYSDILSDKNDSLGESHYRDNKIILQRLNNSFIRPETTIQHTLLHEIVHVILQEMYEHDLKNNEKFVDLFSNILLQVFKTLKY